MKIIEFVLFTTMLYCGIGFLAFVALDSVPPEKAELSDCIEYVLYWPLIVIFELKHIIKGKD